MRPRIAPGPHFFYPHFESRSTWAVVIRIGRSERKSYLFEAETCAFERVERVMTARAARKIAYAGRKGQRPRSVIERALFDTTDR